MSEARRIKSRSGCSNCKRRRVKCDETLPTCRQCARQELDCPGYLKTLKWKPSFARSPLMSAVAAQKPKPMSARKSSRAELSPTSLGSSWDFPILQEIDTWPNYDMEDATSSVSIEDHEAVAMCMPVQHRPTQLVQYYFARTCGVLSSFDSHLNPFRTTIASMMGQSPILYLLVQAMAAAHLTKPFPAMQSEALSLQTEAFSSVRESIRQAADENLSIDDSLMLGVTLLGLTSAWFDVNDTGFTHLGGAQVLLRQWLANPNGRSEFQTSFILGSLLYWQMLSAFVTNNPEESLIHQEFLHAAVREQNIRTVESGKISQHFTQVIPNPLSGFSAEIFLCVGKVGSLCRMRELTSALRDKPSSHTYFLRKAQEIESDLLGLEGLNCNTVKDLGDSQTSIEHILDVSEAYRCGALLQLYTGVPELLRRRLPLSSFSMVETLQPQPYSHQQPGFKEAIHLNINISYSEEEHDFLRALSFHILQILRDIPETSGTCTVQTLILLIAGSWVVRPRKRIEQTKNYESNPSSLQKSNQSESEDEELSNYWRNFTRSRLRKCEEIIGLRPVARIQEIVEEVWRLHDRGREDYRWMSVIAQNGWQTLLG